MLALDKEIVSPARLLAIKKDWELSIIVTVNNIIIAGYFKAIQYIYNFKSQKKPAYDQTL